MKRNLRLRRESLTELTTGELTGVAGAAPYASGLTCPVKDCVTQIFDTMSCIQSCGASCWCAGDGH